MWKVYSFFYAFSLPSMGNTSAISSAAHVWCSDISCPVKSYPRSPPTIHTAHDQRLWSERASSFLSEPLLTRYQSEDGVDVRVTSVEESPIIGSETIITRAVVAPRLASGCPSTPSDEWTGSMYGVVCTIISDQSYNVTYIPVPVSMMVTPLPSSNAVSDQTVNGAALSSAAINSPTQLRSWVVFYLPTGYPQSIAPPPPPFSEVPDPEQWTGPPCVFGCQGSAVDTSSKPGMTDTLPSSSSVACPSSSLPRAASTTPLLSLDDIEGGENTWTFVSATATRDGTTRSSIDNSSPNFSNTSLISTSRFLSTTTVIYTSLSFSTPRTSSRTTIVDTSFSSSTTRVSSTTSMSSLTTRGLSSTTTKAPQNPTLVPQERSSCRVNVTEVLGQTYWDQPLYLAVNITHNGLEIQYLKSPWAWNRTLEVKSSLPHAFSITPISKPLLSKRYSDFARRLSLVLSPLTFWTNHYKRQALYFSYGDISWSTLSDICIVGEWKDPSPAEILGHWTLNDEPRPVSPRSPYQNRPIIDMCH